MPYYVKSFDSDYTTKTLVGEEKVVCQTLEEVLKDKMLKPNTRSFKQEKRLSTTILHQQYTKTYRPQGIIFTTEEKPEYVLPFDLILVTQSEKILVHYYRMRDNLHEFYNHALIPGYEQFIFEDLDSLIKKFHSPEDAWKAVNDFRVANGQKRLPRPKFRLCSYNEAVFMKDIKIHPVAVFGYTKQAKVIADKFGLPHFKSAGDFWNKTAN